MKQSSRILLFLVLVLLASCSYDEMFEKMVPKEESQFAQQYIDKLRARDFTYIKSLMSPEVLSQVNDELLEKMAGYFRGDAPKSVKLIGSQVSVFNNQWRGNFTFEYEFEGGWNLANAALQKTQNGYQVIGINVYQTTASQKELNAFTLSQKSALQYFVLAAAVLVPIVILVTVYACVRTPNVRRKWLWILFILLGFGALRINWTTGEYAMQLLSVHLLGASAFASGPYSPWVVSASVPFGAIMFWFKRKAILSNAQEANK